MDLASNAVVVSDVNVTDTEPLQDQFTFHRGVDAYKFFVDHPVLVHHFNWTAVSTGALCLSQNMIRNYFTRAPQALRNKVSNFYYVRGKIKLTFVVQGAAQCAGMLAFSAIPCPKSGINQLAAVVRTENSVNCRIVPHVLIDPSVSQTLELELPMCTTTGYYDISSNTAGTDVNGSWEVWRRVINPLTTGTANSATISVCVYMTLIDPVFVGLRETLTLLAPPILAEKTVQGSLSSIATGVSKVAAFTGQVFPALGPAATVFSALSGAAGKALAFLGFSKPQAVENLNVVMDRTADNYSQIDGISNALVLGRSQGQTVSIAPGYIGGTLQEMSLEHICSIPVIALQFAITPAIATQTLVMNAAVTPFYSQAFDTPLLVMARMHSMWAGDLTYTWEFIASVFTRCTVLIAYSPVPYAGSAPSFNDALNILQNTTVYISGNTSVSVTVPWTQPQPTKTCQSQTAANNHNGVFYVYVVNPIQSNGSTDNINVNVMIHSDNIAFLAPTPSGITLAPRPQWNVYNENLTDFVPTVTPLAPPIDWAKTVPVSFGPPTDLKNIGAALSGDRTQSLKDLISRMGVTMTVPSNVTNGTLSIRPFPMAYGANIVPHFLSYCLPAFVGSRGSIRISLVCDKPTNVVTSHRLDNYGQLAYIGPWNPAGASTRVNSVINDAYAWSGANTNIASNADVVVPMNVTTNFYPGRNCGVAGSGLAGNTSGLVGLVEFGNIPNDSAVAITKGAGDDFILGGFIGFPTKV